ncbi:hypothetical protein [Microvirga calopogonii]|uniref:hypothetical protein n=1 Tax=Microvirga calopogonii TaxID=2078013 RepID=UPI000E0DF058|nr:hypothetical protein [Microvirga calopogonii]
MTVFPEHFSLQLAPGVHAVLILDQAGWYDPRAVDVPQTVTRLLPAASPELHPVGRFWLHLRERSLSHRVLDDYGAILEAVGRAWNRLLDGTGHLTSLTAYWDLTASVVPEQL